MSITRVKVYSRAIDTVLPIVGAHVTPDNTRTYIIFNAYVCFQLFDSIRDQM